MSDRPTHLLVDLAGVVCGFDPTTRSRAMAAAAGSTPEQVDEALYGSGLVDAWDRGEADAAQVRVALRGALGLEASRAPDDLVDRLWLSAFTPDDEVLAVLDRVPSDVPRALLSNNDALVGDALGRLVPAVARRFPVRLFSGEMHARKPAAHAFLSAVATLDADPASVLFVDDGEDNVGGARRCGLPAVLFRTVPQLRADLQEAGLLAR